MKKKVKFLILLLSANFCFSQIVINNDEKVKIIFPFENVKYSLGTGYLFTIKNDSEFDYMIDTYPTAFMGRANVFKNGEYLNQKLYYPEGYPAERDYEECIKDFEIIGKGKRRNIILPIFKLNGTYDLDKTNSYEIVISNQTFSKKNSAALGCKKYIEEMEKKNLKILEGNINLKLKLVE